MNPTTQIDLGTPASESSETVTIEIDGLPATVKAGSTIMRAARESGVSAVLESSGIEFTLRFSARRFLALAEI